MSNRGKLFKEVKSTLQQRRSLALGFGFVVAVFSISPLVNLLIMPFVVADATALYVEQII